MGLDLGGFGGGLFDNFFGRRHHHDNRGSDIRVEAIVPLQMILTGGDQEIRLSHLRACDICHGTGSAPGTAPRSCETCHGTGQLTNVRQKGNVRYQESRTCPTCFGKGKFIDTPCSECKGSGTVDNPETLTVKIPVGAEEGMVLRIPGHGSPSSAAGGTHGDLLVIVRSAYDPYFTRADADLWHSEKINVLDAILGTEIDISTLEGTVRVHVPQGIQHDAVLRIAKEGLPYFGGSKRGDLFIRIKIKVPENISDDERALYLQLRAIAKKKTG